MVKKLLSRLTQPAAHPSPRPDDPATEAADDSGFFTTLFLDREDDSVAAVAWSTREAAVQGEAVTGRDGTVLLEKAWSGEQHPTALGPGGLARLGRYLAYVRMGPDRELIAQDEHGDYLLIVLEGTVAVDRVQPWGGRARLGEARAGDLLGEMSLLDAGTRFSACRTLTPCTVAVLEAASLDRMLRDEPRLAAGLMAALARRLSLRLRQASARLSALLAQG